MRIKVDAPSFRRMSSQIIFCASLIHVFQAGMMLMFSTASGATPLKALVGIVNYLHLGGDASVAVVMFTTALMAIAGAGLYLGPIRLGLFFVPQQFILSIQAFGGIWASAVGHYLDGTVIPSPHIWTDQVYVAGLSVLHCLAALRRSQ